MVQACLLRGGTQATRSQPRLAPIKSSPQLSRPALVEVGRPAALFELPPLVIGIMQCNVDRGATAACSSQLRGDRAAVGRQGLPCQRPRCGRRRMRLACTAAPAGSSVAQCRSSSVEHLERSLEVGVATGEHSAVSCLVRQVTEYVHVSVLHFCVSRTLIRCIASQDKHLQALVHYSAFSSTHVLVTAVTELLPGVLPLRVAALTGSACHAQSLQAASMSRFEAWGTSYFSFLAPTPVQRSSSAYCCRRRRRAALSRRARRAASAWWTRARLSTRRGRTARGCGAPRRCWEPRSCGAAPRCTTQAPRWRRQREQWQRTMWQVRTGCEALQYRVSCPVCI